MIVYADNAATMRMRETASQSMLQYLRENYGNASSTHQFGISAARAVYSARKTIAKCLNCLDNEIFFTSGGTESNNQAIYAAMKLCLKAGKKHIISTAIEHASIISPLQKLKNRGFEITLLDVNSEGLVSVDKFLSAIKKGTGFVSVMAANNEIGTIQPIQEIGAICRERGILFHSDAVQAIAHIPIDVSRDNIDILSISAHKFGGAKGSGIIFIKNGLDVAPLLCGGGQERGIRPGTENVPSIMAMAAALEETYLNMKSDNQYIQYLRDRIINRLLNIPNSFLNGDKTSRLSNNINIRFDDIEGEALVVLLSQRGIMVSAGSACSSSSNKASHVLKSIGLTDAQARSAIRITLSAENTAREIEYMLACIQESVEYLRSIR